MLPALASRGRRGVAGSRWAGQCIVNWLSMNSTSSATCYWLESASTTIMDLWLGTGRRGARAHGLPTTLRRAAPEVEPGHGRHRRGSDGPTLGGGLLPPLQSPPGAASRRTVSPRPWKAVVKRQAARGAEQVASLRRVIVQPGPRVLGVPASKVRGRLGRHPTDGHWREHGSLAGVDAGAGAAASSGPSG